MHKDEIRKSVSDLKARTPIEILLGIDEDGKTTARQLYEFLELDASNYSRWLKSNIDENPFAEENIDFWVFVTNDENPKGGRPTRDFKLSANFAKKLCMQGKTERAEQARDYFISVENKLKELAIKANLYSYWQQTRQQTKDSRLLETECIKEFVAYAKEQGSQHAERYYCSFTRLANKAAGIASSRENATVQQLNNLSLIEHIIEQVLRECMQQGKPYKEVYSACKARVEQFQEIAYLSTERAIRRNP